MNGHDSPPPDRAVNGKVAKAGDAGEAAEGEAKGEPPLRTGELWAPRRVKRFSWTKTFSVRSRNSEIHPLIPDFSTQWHLVVRKELPPLDHSLTSRMEALVEE